MCLVFFSLLVGFVEALSQVVLLIGNHDVVLNLFAKVRFLQ